MKMIEIVSTAVKAVGYDPSRCIMRLRYSNDGEYDYYGISRDQHYDFLACESKGQYVQRVLKDNSDIPCVRIA
jgi:hypothetical protein